MCHTLRNDCNLCTAASYLWPTLAFCLLLPQLLYTRIKFTYATLNVDSINSNISQPHKKLLSDSSPIIPYALCALTSNSLSTQHIDSSHETRIGYEAHQLQLGRWQFHIFGLWESEPWRCALALILTCLVSHAVPESCDYSNIQWNCWVVSAEFWVITSRTIFWYTDSTFIRSRWE